MIGMDGAKKPSYHKIAGLVGKHAVTKCSLGHPCSAPHETRNQIFPASHLPSKITADETAAKAAFGFKHRFDIAGKSRVKFRKENLTFATLGSNHNSFGNETIMIACCKVDRGDIILSAHNHRPMSAC